jgi:hypothetical protein
MRWEEIKEKYGMREEELEEWKGKVEREMREEEIREEIREELKRERRKKGKEKEREEKYKWEKRYVEEKLEDREGGKVRLKRLYEKYMEWLREEEEVPKEEKCDMRKTTSRIRKYMTKEGMEMKQGKIGGKNYRCLMEKEWVEEKDREVIEKEKEKETETVKEYLEEKVEKTGNKRDRIPVIEIVPEYNKWAKERGYKRYNEEIWKRKSAAVGYKIKTAKAVLKSQNCEICMPCVMGAKMKSEELKEVS